MKILIAGGAGYIGSRLIPELITKNHTITVVDKLWFGNHLPKDVIIDTRYVSELTEKDLEGFDQVIFLGGLSCDPMAEFGPWQNFLFNAATPSYLAYIAKKSGVKRFIYASSCSVYGFTQGEPYTEESPTISNYPYGIAKLQGERGVLQLNDSNFSVIALRKGTLSGYSPRMRLDLVVNTMFKTALYNKKITISNPNIWRPILDIRDCIDAYVKAIDNPLVNGVYNICSYNTTIGKIGFEIENFINQKISPENISVITNNIQDFRNYQVKIDKAKKYLEFIPQHILSSTLVDLWNNRLKFQNIDNDYYYNINIFRNLEL